MKIPKGHQFQLNTEVHLGVCDWFTHYTMEFYKKGIQNFVIQWDACLSAYCYFM